MKKEAKFFKALGDDTRLAIIALLSWREELCVCDIMTVLELTQSKASRHLRYLTQAGILDDRREAVWVYYRITPDMTTLEAGIVKSVQAHFGGKPYAALKKKLEAWLAKKCDSPICKG
ncbi:MAG TPA: metalloregulator ArsR/SmtB family transcription factor [bacterium]|nr:metalloregulator ArsR/SmtB family transcription factor [bacterium]